MPAAVDKRASYRLFAEMALLANRTTDNIGLWLRVFFMFSRCVLALKTFRLSYMILHEKESVLPV